MSVGPQKRTTGPGGPGGGEVNCIPTALVQKLAAKESESSSIKVSESSNLLKKAILIMSRIFSPRRL